MKPPAVGIADLMRATHALRPNAAAIAALAGMLGLALSPEAAPAAGAGPAMDRPDSDEVDDDTPLAPSGTRTGALPPSVKRLEPVRQAASPLPVGNDPLSAAPRPAVRKLAFEGLLTARDGAELLRFAAAVPMAGADLDIDRVVRELSHARPLTELPRIHAPSLELGAQLLVDVGRSMQPFFKDEEELLGQFVRGLRDRVEARYFADDPEAGAGPSRRQGTWKPYAPPYAGTSVIALTDLGCGFPRRADGAQAWLKLAQRLRRAQNRLVVFAPVRPARVPLALRREIMLVLWDRSPVRRNVMQLAGAR